MGTLLWGWTVDGTMGQMRRMRPMSRMNMRVTGNIQSICPTSICPIVPSPSVSSAASSLAATHRLIHPPAQLNLLILRRLSSCRCRAIPCCITHGQNIEHRVVVAAAPSLRPICCGDSYRRNYETSVGFSPDGSARAVRQSCDSSAASNPAPAKSIVIRPPSRLKRSVCPAVASLTSAL